MHYDRVSLLSATLWVAVLDWDMKSNKSNGTGCYLVLEVTNLQNGKVYHEFVTFKIGRAKSRQLGPPNFGPSPVFLTKFWARYGLGPQATGPMQVSIPVYIRQCLCNGCSRMGQARESIMNKLTSTSTSTFQPWLQISACKYHQLSTASLPTPVPSSHRVHDNVGSCISHELPQQCNGKTDSSLTRQELISNFHISVQHIWRHHHMVLNVNASV